MMRIVTDVLQLVTTTLQSYFTKNGQYKHQVYMYVSEKLRSSGRRNSGLSQELSG